MSIASASAAFKFLMLLPCTIFFVKRHEKSVYGTRADVTHFLYSYFIQWILFTVVAVVLMPRV